MARPDTLAAVDLGSNSFHLIVARTGGDGVRVVDRLRETVRLGAGLDAEKRLSGEVRSMIGVIIVTFLLSHALPGDPAAYFAGPAANARPTACTTYAASSSVIAG